MILELHDNETGNTFTARVNDIDYDHQAEQWVQDTADQRTIVKWILIDDEGTRCIWERPVGSTAFPDITRRSPRFAGEWQHGPAEVAI